MHWEAVQEIQAVGEVAFTPGLCVPTEHTVGDEDSSGQYEFTGQAMHRKFPGTSLYDPAAHDRQAEEAVCPELG